MTQYLVKYWINVDMLAEEVVDSEHINIDTNDLGKFNLGLICLVGFRIFKY